MRPLVHVALLLLLASSAGCAGADRPDGGADAAPEVRDSAGIRLVTYAPPDPWTMPGRLVEELRIGALEGGPDERLFGLVAGGMILGDGSFFGFERWGLDGRLEEIVRVDVKPPDVDSLAAAWIESELAAVPEGEEELRQRTRARAEAIEWPERSAYFVDMVVTEDRVLLKEVPYDGDGRWFVFAADGEPLSYLPLPPGASLLDMKGDRILVVERTALDVPQVVLYSLAARGTDGD